MWIDRAVKWLMPREEKFYDLLVRGAVCAREAAGGLAACCREAGEGRRAHATRVGQVEQEADRIIAEVYESLNKTFVTPIDREDIYGLASELEDLTDTLFEATLRFETRAIEEVPAGGCELAGHIEQACRELERAVGRLRGMKEPEEVRRGCEEVKRLEGEGDQIFRDRLAEMFRSEHDAIRLIKHKELLESLGRALHACDKVSSVILSIVVKNS